MRCSLKGVVARRMHAAVAPFAADQLHHADGGGGGQRRGRNSRRDACARRGSIALTSTMAATSRCILTRASSSPSGLMDRPDRQGLMRTMTIDADDPARGIATSGRHGRSFSLGIADAVTVLARTASQADAAATIIANAVDLPGHPAIVRCPANELQPDSDLGARLVTRDVGALGESEIDDGAEGRRRSRAQQLLAAGLIEGAALRLTRRDGRGGRKWDQARAVAGVSRRRGRKSGACLIGSEADKMSAIIRKIVTVVEETHIWRWGRRPLRRRRGARRRSP